jgi:hypothetical protein
MSIVQLALIYAENYALTFVNGNKASPANTQTEYQLMSTISDIQLMGRLKIIKDLKISNSTLFLQKIF